MAKTTNALWVNGWGAAVVGSSKVTGQCPRPKKIPEEGRQIAAISSSPESRQAGGH